MNFKTFISISSDVRRRVKIKRSEFIVSAQRVHSEIEVKNFLTKVAKEFRDASHNCWAYKIGFLESSSDAGEPSGTAGVPILGSIKSSRLDRIAVVVTRYFGGIKLGIRGLIDAYSRVAALALDSAKKVRFLIGKKIVVEVGYPDLEKMMYKFRKAGYFYAEPPQFTEKIRLELFIPQNAEIDIPHKELGICELSEEKLIHI